LKSIYHDSYQTLLSLLVEARNAEGLTQQQLADKLERPQSFISKIENGDRRLDVIEFLQICRLLRADPYAVLKRIETPRKRR
jgi:transcriptional regulator with XRE-family HTH domain